jgi:hypothetical protein
VRVPVSVRGQILGGCAPRKAPHLLVVVRRVDSAEHPEGCFGRSRASPRSRTSCGPRRRAVWRCTPVLQNEAADIVDRILRE